jgi:hypothetical protein
MGSIVDKIAELMEDGYTETFNPENVQDVLSRAYKTGWRQTVMFTAMDNIRSNPKLTNDEAILMSAKKYDII